MKPKKLHSSRSINLLFKGLLSFATLTLVLILVPVMAHALTSVTVTWDENNPVPEGYILHWGTASGNYTSSHDAGTIWHTAMRRGGSVFDNKHAFVADSLRLRNIERRLA